MKLDEKKLAAARKRKKLSINVVASCLNIPPTLIGCWESGRRPLITTSTHVDKLLKLYEVELDDMI